MMTMGMYAWFSLKVEMIIIKYWMGKPTVCHIEDESYIQCQMVNSELSWAKEGRNQEL